METRVKEMVQVGSFINPSSIEEAEKVLKENSKLSDNKLSPEVGGVPLKYSSYGFRGLDVTEENSSLVQTCKDYFAYKTSKGSLFMYGGIGTGKTRLAVAILKNLRPIPHYGSYRKATANFLIADEFFLTMNDAARGDSKMQLLKKIMQHDIITLDDVGLENFSSARQENLYLFINRAYVMEKKIIITSNFSPQDLQKIDPRITDRLREMSLFLEFRGKSYR